MEQNLNIVASRNNNDSINYRTIRNKSIMNVGLNYVYTV